jgi:hypothetical protein
LRNHGFAQLISRFSLYNSTLASSVGRTVLNRTNAGRKSC